MSEKKKIVEEDSGIVLPKGQTEMKTEIGRKVVTGEIIDIETILSSGKRLLEETVVDMLIPDLETDLLLIGQAKGKFGGGQRRAFRQTQKKTKQGNTPKFTTLAVVGNKNGYVGIGMGCSRETVPAREKAYRQAKLNLIKVPRGYAGPDLVQGEPHTVPFSVTGKCGSCEIILRPAPKGTGLVIEKECAKILRLAGYKDVYSKSFGKSSTRINNVKACFDALKKLGSMKVTEDNIQRLGIVYGRL